MMRLNGETTVGMVKLQLKWQNNNCNDEIKDEMLRFQLK